MKNISLALNAVLIIAVAILYYLQFSEKEVIEKEVINEIENPVNVEDTVSVEEIDSKIGYINVDTLQKNYKLYAELIDKLKAKEKKYDNELSMKSAAFEKKYRDLQQKAQAGTLTQFEGELKQKELQEEQEKLLKMRDDLAVKFQDEEAKLNDEFQKNVKDFIKEYNKDKNYNIIIGASELGNVVLYYNEGINISNAVISGLNEQYHKKKSMPVTPAKK